jgi:hypothetical protein
MSTPQLDYQRIQKYVEDNLHTRQDRTRVGLFVAHLMISVTLGILVFVNLLIATTNPSDPGTMMGGVPLPPGALMTFMVLGIAMLAGLIFHTAAFAASSRGHERQLREDLTAKAVQLELARLGMSEADFVQEAGGKPKRYPLGSIVRLSDDGELVPDQEHNSNSHYEQESTQAKANHS